MILKSVVISRKEFSNRVVLIREDIYSNYDENKLVIEVYPDEEFYSIKLATGKGSHGKILSFYELYKDEKKELGLYIFNKPEYYTDSMKKKGLKAYVLFSLYRRIGNSIIDYYIPFLLLDKENHLLIEKRLHNILKKEDYDIQDVINLIYSVWVGKAY